MVDGVEMATTAANIGVSIRVKTVEARVIDGLSAQGINSATQSLV